MKYSAAVFLLMLLPMPGSQAVAEELEISTAELRSLGITFAEPQPAESVEVVAARAHVTIPPSHEYIVSSALPGLVARVHARQGEQLSAGDVLVEVRSAEFLTLQQEFLESLYYGRLAAAQLERDEQLAEEGIIAERRLEETRANAAAAAGRQAEHRQLLRIAGMSDTEIGTLASEQLLDDTLLVRAPVDGAVLNVFATAGESVSALEALLRMADVSRLWLDIHLPQEFSEQVDVGMSVSSPEQAEPLGEIISVGQAVDPETQVISVLAEVTRSGHRLKPGQLVAVHLVDSAAADGDIRLRSIPSASLVRTGDATYVFIRSPGGVLAQAVNVVGGLADRTSVRGLDGEAVAVTGVSALKALWLASSESND